MFNLLHVVKEEIKYEHESSMPLSVKSLLDRIEYRIWQKTNRTLLVPNNKFFNSLLVKSLTASLNLDNCKQTSMCKDRFKQNNFF